MLNNLLDSRLGNLRPALVDERGEPVEVRSAATEVNAERETCLGLEVLLGYLRVASERGAVFEEHGAVNADLDAVDVDHHPGLGGLGRGELR